MAFLSKFKFLFIIFLVLACQKDPVEDEKCSVSTGLNSKIIIGTNDWIQFLQTNNESQNANEQTVALVKIPAMMATCTGFLINRDTIMTNNHCISGPLSAVGVQALFRNEDSSRTTYVCDEFIMTNVQYDFTLVRCNNSPGDHYGYVGLTTERPLSLVDIYLVQENCDYIANPRCLIDKYVAFGKLLESQTYRVYHNADTLGGSSGSPIFSKTSHQVIALHNSASPATTTTPERNGGVPMYKIRGVIETTTNVDIFEFGTAGIATDETPIPDPVVTPVPNDPPSVPSDNQEQVDEETKDTKIDACKV